VPFDSAEIHERRAPRLLGAHPASDALLDLELEMKADFLLHLSLGLSPAEQVARAA
jgi:hypothetical protein